jgi:DNA-binding transcriptional ArsR family regulator
MLALRISQPRASRHLGVLKAAGFLKSRQTGSRVFYALNDTAGSKAMFGVLEMADALALRDAALRIDRERLAMIEAGGIGELIGSYRPLVRKYRKGTPSI